METILQFVLLFMVNLKLNNFLKITYFECPVECPFLSIGNILYKITELF